MALYFGNKKVDLTKTINNGGGGFIDVTELPTKNINKDAVYRLIERKESELVLWLAGYSDGATFDMAFNEFLTMAGVAATITLTVVDTLPDTMDAANFDTWTFPCYVLASTGVAYMSIDGTSDTAVPFGETLLEVPGIDKGWIDSKDDIVLDTSTDNVSIYTIRPGTQLVPKGLFAYSDGWYELEKTLETTKKPREQRVYMIIDGEALDYIEYIENSGGSVEGGIEFVDELPLWRDGLYVLNATGFLYFVIDGKVALVTDIFPSNVCYGWVDSIEEMDTSKSGAVYALRGSKTDVIYKVGENGTTNEVYIHENDEWQEFAKKGGSVDVIAAKDINFYDYDGTLLSSYTIEEMAQLTELPTPPSHEGLTFEQWNYDLSTLQSYNRPADVGATYVTDDGKTRIYISLNENIFDKVKNFELYYTSEHHGGVTIDWGDGTGATLHGGIGARMQPHEYTKSGDYVITIEPGVDTEFRLGWDGTQHVVHSDSDSDKVYAATVTKIELGHRAGISKYGCSMMPNLETVTISTTGEVIDEYAFSHCFSLKCVIFPKAYYSTSNGMFSGCQSLKVVSIPYGLKYVARETFQNCQQLKQIKLPKESGSVDPCCFEGCTLLKRVLLPNQITIISNSLFSGCNCLENVVIPAGVTIIWEDAFRDCFNITKVIMPKSVSSIKNNAFYGTVNITCFDFSQHTSIPTLENTEGLGLSVDMEIRVPLALADAWKVAENWSAYADKIVGV